MHVTSRVGVRDRRPRAGRPLLLVVAGTGLIIGSFAAARPNPQPQDQGAGEVLTAQDQPQQQSDRRNPRRIRDDAGEPRGPRMVAGGMPIEGILDSLAFYDRLEPLIGEWTMTGQIWRRPGNTPFDVSGTWSNAWILDGQYMQCALKIDQRPRPYELIGLLCYESRQRRYEASFFSSNGTVRTFRWGDFEDDSAADASAAAAANGATAPEKGGTLTLLSRSSIEETDAQPTSKVALEIVSDDEFHYIGWARNSDGEWWKTQELVMKRVN